MSAKEYYCPACESPLRSWDFVAPKDFYRCWECLEATPFHMLPQRDILKTWTGGVARSEIISRGTAREIISPSDLTFQVECSAGSILLLGVAFTPDVLDPTISSFSATWGSQTFASVAMQEGFIGQTTAIRALVASSSGTKTLTINPQGPCSIAAFATEITAPALPAAVDASGTNGAAFPSSVSVTSSAATAASEVAICAVGSMEGIGIATWDSPFITGQGTDVGPLGANILEGRRILSATGPVTATITIPQGLPTAEWGACIATFRIT